MDFKRHKINVLGVYIDDVSFDEAVEKILNFSRSRKGGHFVATVNSEFIMMAKRDEKFLDVLNKADLNVADSMGTAVAKLIMGGKVYGRVTGVDLVETLCQKSAEKSVTVGFLGGFSPIARELAKRQRGRYENLKISYAEAGNPSARFDSRLRRDLKKAGRIDILFVAYGMGTQEFWIERNRNTLDIGVFIGVGGAFDYLSGVKKRAPIALQRVGLEWLFRLLREPSRFKRMSVLPIFAMLVFREKFLEIVRPINRNN